MAKFLKQNDIWRRRKNLMKKCHQSNFVVNNASMRFQRYVLWMLCTCNQLFCVHSGCHNNENNMSDSNTDVGHHVRKEEYLQSFWKSGVSMAKHQSNLKIKGKKVRKIVFITWLAAKIRLSFFKNTVQLQLSTNYTAKVNFVSSGT